MSTLSATAQAAIAAIGTPIDLQLKTELSPTVRVLTSYMLIPRHYESLVVAPDDVIADMYQRGIFDQSRYATRAEAEAGHQQVVTRVGMLLQRLKERAS